MLDPMKHNEKLCLSCHKVIVHVVVAVVVVGGGGVGVGVGVVVVVVVVVSLLFVQVLVVVAVVVIVVVVCWYCKNIFRSRPRPAMSKLRRLQQGRQR